MTRRKLFFTLANISGLIGIGMLLAYGFSDRINKSPFYLGIILVIAGALLLGMYISARSEPKPKDDRPVSSSGNITDLPPKH